jgi:sugar lactone lactonase YvrE
LSAPAAVAVDGSGNLFIADTGNNRVVKVTAAGVQSVVLSGTVAGATLKGPTGIAVDAAGTLYLADTGNNRVLKVTSGGAASTVGTGLAGPQGVSVDAAGTVFIADTGNNRILDVIGSTQHPLINTYDADIGAPLSKPVGLSIQMLSGGTSEALYIADSGNNRVFWGYVQSYVPGTLSFSYYGLVGDSLNKPTGIAFASAAYGTFQYGFAYIADTGSGQVLSESNFSTQTVQAQVQASVTSGIAAPGGLAADNGGNIFIAEPGKNRIVKLATSHGVGFGKVNVGSASAAVPLTFAFTTNTILSAPALLTQGAANQDFLNAGTGTCAAKVFQAGTNCTVNVLFKPASAGERKGAINQPGQNGKNPAMDTATAYLHGIGVGPQIAYDPGVQSILATGLNDPRSIAVDGSGNVYVADFGDGNVVKITQAGVKSTLANFNGLLTLGLDGAGNLYVAAQYAAYETGEKIFMVSPTGVVTDPGFFTDYPIGIAVDGSGNIFVTDFEIDRVEEIPSSGTTSFAVTGGFVPSGVAVDSAGNLFIVDSTNWLVWKYSATGMWSTVGYGYARPQGVAVDGQGNVYVADFGNNRVVKVSPAGVQTTVGTGLVEPTAVALDGAGNIYIADFGNSRVVKIDRGDPPKLAFAATVVGRTSSDSPKSVTVDNIGNAALTFPAPATGKNASLSAGFTLGSATTCPVLTTSSSAATLAVAATCGYLVSFAPTAAGAVTGSLVMTDNNLNAAKAAQTVSLTGSATPGAAVVQLGNLSQTFTGAPAAVTAATDPSGLKVALTYNGKTTAPTAAGNYAVAATVSSPNYKGSATGTLVIAKAAPAVAWAVPAAITQGTALSAKQLNATSKIPGKFTYTPAAGNKPAKGTVTLSVTFTPTDSANYKPATATVKLVVN